MWESSRKGNFCSSLLRVKIVQGSLWHGTGRLTMKNSVYEGEWAEGAKHGSGVLFYSSGDIYQVVGLAVLALLAVFACCAAEQCNDQECLAQTAQLLTSIMLLRCAGCDICGSCWFSPLVC